MCISVLCNSADSNTFYACGASNDRMIVDNKSESAWKETFVSHCEVQCQACLKELRTTALNIGPVSPFPSVIRNGLFPDTKEGRYSVSQLAALASAVRC